MLWMWNDQYSEAVCTSLIPWNPPRSRTTTTSLNSQGTNTQKKTIFKKFLVRSCHYLVTHDEKNQKQCLEKIKEKQRKNIKSKMI